MSRRHRLAAVLTSVLTAVLTGLLGLVAALAVVPPAHAASPSYVALGDSYSSGVGTRTYLSDGTSCQRSVYAFRA